jgi:hypothetical protein
MAFFSPVVDANVAEIMEGKIFNPSLFTDPCRSNTMCINRLPIPKKDMVTI